LLLDGAFGLPFQFLDCARAAAGNGLIACGENPANAENAVQRVKCHQRDRRRAIRIGNQTAVPPHILRIDFGDNERHVRLQPKN
jgi:hypothetical protein